MADSKQNPIPKTRYRVLAQPPGTTTADIEPLKAVVPGFDWDDAAGCALHQLEDDMMDKPGTWRITVILLKSNGKASEFHANGFALVDASGVRQPPMGEWAKLGLATD